MYIVEGLYICMYGEGDTVKKYATHVRGEKVIVFILSYVFVMLVAAALMTTLFYTMKSYYVNQWFGKVSIHGFMQVLESGNRYFSSDFFQKERRISPGKLLFSAATDIQLEDIRTLVGKEVPGMSSYYSEILVAGEGTDFTNIPNESSVPIDEVTKKREVAEEKVKEAEKNHPVKEKGKNVQGKNAVFIYHSHSWESFFPLLPGAKSASSPDVNISLLGERFKEQLEAEGIPTLHDKTNMGDLLAEKNWEWYKSYDASRGIVKEAIAQNENITFPVDIHRDSATKEKTTKVINGKPYARLYFIIGMENAGRNENIKITKEINSYLEKNYPGISRGVFNKDRREGNGVYNQDLSPNSILVEIGGVDNTLEELYNTVDVLTEAFSEYYWEAEKVNG
ncbi:stage II sporulation protein P [Bacillus manliponensis]|uniref:Stage II sporulation protein P n=1 Tax=Bacillus manliponensis TaxID=574376 RepID=A0A073K0E0_9BACI|nr:stage II sporulation protein P [Bacillus manliponensis]KEK20001.1 stage II sporulation protein P [Bacillus manliponensis]